jgi:hypothetical protein
MRFMVNKVAWSRFSPSAAGSPFNNYSTECSSHLVSKAGTVEVTGGRRTEWNLSHQTKIFSLLITRGQFLSVILIVT